MELLSSHLAELRPCQEPCAYPSGWTWTCERRGSDCCIGSAPTSNGSSAQHFAFVRSVNLYSSTTHLIEVYTILSFTIEALTIERMMKLRQCFSHSRHRRSVTLPTPEAFGTPLGVIGFKTHSRDSWLHIAPSRFVVCYACVEASEFFFRFICAIFLFFDWYIESSLNEWNRRSSHVEADRTLPQHPYR